MTQTQNADDSVETLPILQEIHRAFGMVPNLFRSYAKHPKLLEANWSKVKAVLLNGSIDRKTKEFMAYLISLDNGCSYCVAAHSAALHSFGIQNSQIDAVLLGLYPRNMKASDVALIKFARKVNQHWREITDEDIAALSRLEIEESKIIETLGMVELFGGFNRYAKVMKVEVDF